MTGALSPEDRELLRSAQEQARREQKQAPPAPGEPTVGPVARRVLDGIPSEPSPREPNVVDMEHLRASHRQDTWEQLIPRRFHTVTPDTLPPLGREAITEWRQSPNRNLVLLGEVGTGKTSTAVAAARLYHDAGYRILFRPVVELLDDLRPDGDHRRAIQEATEVDLLILDELGGERQTDWTAERLYRIVNRRWMECLPTVVTANLSAEDLEAAVGPRMFSRLAQGAVAWSFKGPDLRRRS